MRVYMESKSETGRPYICICSHKGQVLVMGPISDTPKVYGVVCMAAATEYSSPRTTPKVNECCPQRQF